VKVSLQDWRGGFAESYCPAGLPTKAERYLIWEVSRDLDFTNTIKPPVQTDILEVFEPIEILMYWQRHQNLKKR